MSANRSAEALLAFLDYLGQKGLVPTATAASRKATANKVLAILSDDEAEDVLSLDLDHLMQRFHHLNPGQYTPESLQTYKSRMKTALEDFRSYSDNPLAFRPTGQSRSKPRGKTEKPPSSTKLESDGGDRSSQSTSIQSAGTTLPGVSILPIHLRPDLIVQIAGLPFDLTAQEAKKIANIVLAHVMDS